MQILSTVWYKIWLLSSRLAIYLWDVIYIAWCKISCMLNSKYIQHNEWIMRVYQYKNAISIHSWPLIVANWCTFWFNTPTCNRISTFRLIDNTDRVFITLKCPYFSYDLYVSRQHKRTFNAYRADICTPEYREGVIFLCFTDTFQAISNEKKNNPV